MRQAGVHSASSAFPFFAFFMRTEYIYALLILPIMKYLTFFLCAGIALFTNCKASRDFPNEYKGERLHFGQGGGFTGKVNSFVLLDDGRLFEKQDTAMTYRDKWDAQFTRQVFSNYRTLQLDNVDHNQPGNLYYFIVFYNDSSKEPHRIVWGREGHKPDQKVINFYQILFQSTEDKS